jgi:hypothetical protein
LARTLRFLFQDLALSSLQATELLTAVQNLFEMSMWEHLSSLPFGKLTHCQLPAPPQNAPVREEGQDLVALWWPVLLGNFCLGVARG